MSEEMKNFGGLLTEFYKDSAQPTVRIAGQALGSIADLVLSPVGRCTEITKKNVLRFLDKFDGEDQNNIVSPAPNIGVPVLQKLSYTEDEDLVELYTELLKNSCLKNFQKKVLPSYINIISSLTPDEIRLIDYLFKKKYIVYFSPDMIQKIDPEILMAYGPKKNSQGEFQALFSQIPFLEVRNKSTSKNEWRRQIKYFTDIVNRVKFQEPENIELYFENLKAMGIFEIRDDQYMAPVEVYDHLEKNDIILRYRTALEKQGRTIVMEKGQIEFTDLGISFLKSCTRRNQAQ